MRRFVLGLALAAAVAVPLGSTPVSAGSQGGYCPDGYYGPLAIQEIQLYDPRAGIARAAAAADVNHDSYVCYKERGARGVTFKDNIPYYGG
jgi:hypothetical protein